MFAKFMFDPVFGGNVSGVDGVMVVLPTVNDRPFILPVGNRVIPNVSELLETNIFTVGTEVSTYFVNTKFALAPLTNNEFTRVVEDIVIYYLVRIMDQFVLDP